MKIPKGKIWNADSGSWVTMASRSEYRLMTGAYRCRRPPRGWFCSLLIGHDGPCPTRMRWWMKLLHPVRARW